MPVPDFESYKVAALELSSITKFNNFVQAVEDEFADIDTDQIPGYPTAYGTYVPVWTCAGTAPSLGNGSLTGRFAQVGKLTHVNINLVAGSTTTFGTGQFILSLPAATPATGYPIASVLYFDSSAGLFFPGNSWAVSTTTLGLYDNASPLAAVTNAAPFAWATADQILLQLAYEAA